MQFSVQPRTPLFWGVGNLTPLQGIQSAYSKPHRQSESTFGLDILPFNRGYSQHILSLTDKASLPLGAGLTPRQGIQLVYSKPHYYFEKKAVAPPPKKLFMF